jgi:MoaA/NifB/PqqE/SkfB family radical SAM enzyme
MTQKTFNHNSDPHNVEAYYNFLKEKTQVINGISPTFCAAKWLQSTILLYNGETHSCHHPSRHKITLDDIRHNPKGIHNTLVKIKARKDMLEGIQTNECDYCWKIENLDKGNISDRIYKSTYSWSLPYIDKIKESGYGEDIDPTYLEVAFESTCNFKCIYCSPESSTRWQEEIDTHGPIKQTNFAMHDLNWLKSVGKLPIHRNDYNPYIEAFWEWWPSLYPKLHTFRITGGEPLLSKHTWRVLEYIKENPNKNLVLAINSNFNVPEHLIDKLLEILPEILPNIKNFEVYTSLESTEKHAEYTRFGMNFEQFIKNCEGFLQKTPDKVRLNFMTTINVLSAPTLINFLEVIRELRSKYTSEKHNFRVRTHLSYLRWPQCLSILLLSEEDKEKYSKLWREYIDTYKLTPNHLNTESFYIEEADQIYRLIHYMNSKKEESFIYDDLRMYIKQCDERRKTNFSEIFPELSYLLSENYYG